MKIVVIGYGQMFASLVLGSIASGHQIVGVFRHDRVNFSGFRLFFKDIFNPSNDLSFIKSLKLNEIKAKSVNSEKFKKEILKLNPDIILVGSWSEKIKKEIFSLPKIAAINCHPSLLPKFRGPNPYAQVILAAEKKTGITFHLIDENFDTGAILAQHQVDILDDDTGATLKARCCNCAKIAVSELLDTLSNDIIIPIKQDERHATYQKCLNQSDIIINLSETSEQISRRIRALSPWTKCYIPFEGAFFKVLGYKITQTDIVHNELKPLVRQSKKEFCLVTSDKKKIIFMVK